MRRRQAPARTHALPLPRRRRRRQARESWLPSGRSLALGLGLLVAAASAYLVARETSVFALQRIEVHGAPPALARRIESALAPLIGTSLVTFASPDAGQRLAGLPQIATASYDRDFPHTLRVFVAVEKPVAVLRKASDAWLVAGSGRVLDELRPGSYPPLPRIWLPPATGVTVGAPLGIDADLLRIASLLRSVRLPALVQSVREEAGGAALVLPGRREIRLGDMTNLPAKVAIAAAILPRAEGAGYVDVSVPTRPVAGYAAAPAQQANAQVSGQG